MTPSIPVPTPAPRSIRLLIVDDNPQVRRDLRQLLTLTSELEVTGEAGSGPEALRQADLLHPDMIFMDLGMPGMDGFEAARQIKAAQPGCRVIAFSIHGCPLSRQKAAQAGMDGFIEKGTPLGEILETVLRVWNADESQ